MKSLIGIIEPYQILIFHQCRISLQQISQGLQRLFIRVASCKPDRKGFEAFAKNVMVSHLMAVEDFDHEASMGPRLDQPLLHESLESFPDRGATASELLGDLFIRDLNPPERAER